MDKITNTDTESQEVTLKQNLVRLLIYGVALLCTFLVAGSFVRTGLIIFAKHGPS